MLATTAYQPRVDIASTRTHTGHFELFSEYDNYAMFKTVCQAKIINKDRLFLSTFHNIKTEFAY